MTSPAAAAVDSKAARPSRATLGLTLAAMLAIWSGNYLAGKLSLRYIDPLSFASLRIELAALVMLAMHFFRRAPWPARRDFVTFALLGFFGVAINQGCFTVGLAFTSSAHSVIIVALDPIIILLAASALKLESLTTGKVIGMAISFAGVLLLETERNAGQPAPLTGDVITFCGVLGFCAFSILGKQAAGRSIGERYDALSITTFMTVTAGVFLAPLAVRQGIRLDWGHVSWVAWTGIAYMAIMASLVSYALFNWVLRHMEVSRVAAVNYLQVPIVIVLAVGFLGERPSAHLLSGAALVLLGVYLAERKAGLASSNSAG